MIGRCVWTSGERMCFTRAREQVCDRKQEELLLPAHCQHLHVTNTQFRRDPNTFYAVNY